MFLATMKLAWLQKLKIYKLNFFQAGVWSCGLANPGCDLNKNLGNDLNSWALTNDNVFKVNGNIEQKLSQKIQEGDIIVSVFVKLNHAADKSAF